MIAGFKRPKRLLFFINPFGGKKRAPKIYKEKVEPILRMAGIHVKSVITERANHAKDLIETGMDEATFNSYDGIICVGGDGMFAELLNGILIRTQDTNNIDYHETKSHLMEPNIPLGVIPAGSTDAVAFSVTGTNDPVTSIIQVIFGKKVNIDVSAIHDPKSDDKLIRYATSFLAYGYFGDVLLDSENHRWMGPSRYDWAGLKKFIGLKKYEGEIKLYTSKFDGSPKDKSICQSDCAVCAKSKSRSKLLGSLEHNSSHPNDNHNDVNINPVMTGCHDEKQQQQQHNDVTVGNDTSCLTIKGKFLAVNSATMTCRCDKTKKGMSPAAHLGNGCADLIIVSECSRLDYLRFLMRTGFLATSAVGIHIMT